MLLYEANINKVREVIETPMFKCMQDSRPINLLSFIRGIKIELDTLLPRSFVTMLTSFISPKEEKRL